MLFFLRQLLLENVPINFALTTGIVFNCLIVVMIMHLSGFYIALNPHIDIV